MGGIDQITEDRGRNNVRKPTVKNQDRKLIKALDNIQKFYTSPGGKGKFYPSGGSLGNPCDRNLYLAYNGKLNSKLIEARISRIFKVGGSLEDRYDTYWNKLGILLDKEKTVRLTSPKISGRIDYILSHEDPKIGKFILELKSINKKGYDELIDVPKPEHHIQIQCYMGITGIPYGIVFYECKDDQSVRAFKVLHDEEMWQGIIDRCKRIMAMTEMPEECTGAPWCDCRVGRE